MRIPADAQLLKAARSGEPSGLGVLIERHRASMQAVALSLLGHGPEAEDAVQDAIVVALARMGELREPDSAGAWLRSVVRNNCLMSLRRGRRAPPLDALEPLAAVDVRPDVLLENHSLRDWTFHALDQLSEPLQLVALLRYFTDVTSYDEIAAFCAVPIGTVRSRLNEAKKKLGEALLSAASQRYDDVRARTAQRAREAAQLFQSVDEGRFACAAGEMFHPDLTIVGPNRAWGTDLPFLVHVIDGDRTDGVQHRMRNVVAGTRITIWEMDLVSPADDPTHCPPSIVWAHVMDGGKTQHLRLFHPA
jgi:RNA polymerase sigma factor (sigma-70 family)